LNFLIHSCYKASSAVRRRSGLVISFNIKSFA
jgi:hypothetical protein